MTGIFIGLSESELLAIRDAARRAAASNAQIVSFSTPDGFQVAKQAPMPPKEILLEVRYALQRLAPDTYGRDLTITRTRARFL